MTEQRVAVDPSRTQTTPNPSVTLGHSEYHTHVLHKATSTGSAEPEPTLRDILSAVTSCNLSFTVLATEVKGMKAQISFIRQDMQKLRDHTSAIRG